MDKAPTVATRLQETRDQEWVLDPATGRIVPEEDPAPRPETTTQAPAQPRPQPAPVQAAYQTYD